MCGLNSELVFALELRSRYTMTLYWHSEFGHLIRGDMIASMTIQMINEQSYQTDF
jgi:hypothetical protein